MFKPIITTALLAAAFCVPAPMLHAEESLSDVLAKRIESQAKHDIQHYAKAHDWPDYEVSVSAWVPGLSNHHLQCDQKPHIAKARESEDPWGRVSYEIRCDKPEWSIRARADVELHVPVVKAARRLGREERLTADDLTVELSDVSRIFGEFVTRKTELVGRQVLRRTRAGQAISRQMTSAPYWVEEGVKVLIRVNQNGIVASMPGISLDNGSKGDPVRVKNLSSGKTITAWVVDRGVVETRF